MKNKASGLLKRVITALTTMAKAKTMALKSKTKAIKTRLVIFSLLHQNRKLLMSSFSEKLSSLMGQSDKKDFKELEDGDCDGDQQSQAIVVYNSNNSMWHPSKTQTEMEQQLLLDKGEYEPDGDGGKLEEKYPDLTHSLFDSEEAMEFEDPGGSVIDIVKTSKEDKGEEFRLEDEIDRVAELFISRFHREMRMQKQLSLKRQREMTEKSV